MRLGVLGCALLLWLGCGDDSEPSPREDSTAKLDAGVEAARPPRRVDAAIEAGPPTIEAALGSACTASLAIPPASACNEPDPTEPNSERSPALLRTDDGCAVLRALAADKDEDAYRFSSAHADPVLIELLYHNAARAELGLSVYSDNKLTLRSAQRRSSPTELEATTFVPQPGTAYDIRVEGSNVGDCVPYALRVDPSWCSDDFEDNDSPAAASPLDLSRGAVELTASGSRYEADYYAFTPSRTDPVSVSGSYTVDLSSNVQLRRVLSNVTGLGAIDDPGARTGTHEEWQHWLRSDTPSYIVQIAPTGEGCVRYQLRVDPHACSDAYEDNDGADQAQPLPLGQDIEASAFRGDDDYYTLPSTDGGHCSLAYQADDNQQLRIEVFSTGAGLIASGLGRALPSEAQTVDVKWLGALAYLRVSAELAQSCQPYHLRCEAGVPAQ